MATANDERIPGGDTTPEVIDVRTNHVSDLVYYGQQFDYSTEKCREHSRWRSSRGHQEIIWELTPEQAALVEAHGFHHIDSVRLLSHDRALLLALAERWWPKHHCFQFSFGEMTVTLEDVAQLLGLPITGEPVLMNTDLDAGNMIREYLGIEPPEDLNAKSMVKYTWLRDNFLNPSQTATEEVDADGARGATVEIKEAQVQNILHFWEGNVRAMNLLPRDASMEPFIVIPGDDQLCPICYEAKGGDLGEVRVLLCQHSLHTECLKVHLSYRRNSFPMCRGAIPIVLL